MLPRQGSRIHGKIIHVCVDTKGAHEFGSFWPADRFLNLPDSVEVNVLKIERMQIENQAYGRIVFSMNGGFIGGNKHKIACICSVFKEGWFYYSKNIFRALTERNNPISIPRERHGALPVIFSSQPITNRPPSKNRKDHASFRRILVRFPPTSSHTHTSPRRR